MVQSPSKAGWNPIRQSPDKQITQRTAALDLNIHHHSAWIRTCRVNFAIYHLHGGFPQPCTSLRSYQRIVCLEGNFVIMTNWSSANLGGVSSEQRHTTEIHRVQSRKCLVIPSLFLKLQRRIQPFQRCTSTAFFSATRLGTTDILEKEIHLFPFRQFLAIQVHLVEPGMWTYIEGRPLKVPGIDSGGEAI